MINVNADEICIPTMSLSKPRKARLLLWEIQGRRTVEKGRREILLSRTTTSGGMQRAEECVGVGCMDKPREDVASVTRENSAGRRLEHDAVRVLLASLGPAQEGRPCRILENFAHALSRLGRTFQIVLGANLLSNSHALE